MGQKINPTGLRIGITEDWRSKWYADKNYAEWLREDMQIREFIKEKHYTTGISKVEIERAANKIKVIVHTSKPGIIIGKKGSGVEKLRAQLEVMTGVKIMLQIVEVRKAELDAQLVAENVAQQLVRRVSFRRAMKKAVSSTMRLGAEGMRIACAGRLGGAEMGRREWYLEGRVPLHTLRANIDFGLAEADTTYGIIGVKVWIFKGEILDSNKKVS